MPDTPFLPCALNQNAAHRFRSGAEEMSSILPLMIFADEPDPRLMHEGGGLKRVTRRFVCHFLCGQFAQFVVNQRQQFVGSFWIALLRAVENLCDVADARRLR